MDKTIPKLRSAMKKIMDEKRYEHTLGVAYTSADLAACHGEDPEKALIAGLLHDNAKCMTNEKRLSICKKHDLPVSEFEKANPFLLHAKVGAFRAEDKYGITDQDILNAIRSHTTGRPGMSRLEKIVFIADYIEPGRTHSKRLPELRKLAFADLDQALIEILRDTLNYLSTKVDNIDPQTKETYDYYVETKKKPTQRSKKENL